MRENFFHDKKIRFNNIKRLSKAQKKVRTSLSHTVRATTPYTPAKRFRTKAKHFAIME